MNPCTNTTRGGRHTRNNPNSQGHLSKREKMTLRMSDELHTSSITVIIAHHLWHNKVKPPTWHGKTYTARNFDNNSGILPTLLRMLPSVHDGDRTPRIRNTKKTFQLYHQLRRVADFKQQRPSSFRTFLLPFTASKGEALHICQICRFSTLVSSIRTLEQNLPVLQLVVSPCHDYELLLVRGEEKPYLLLLLSAPFFHRRRVLPLSEPCDDLFFARTSTSCFGSPRADK